MRPWFLDHFEHVTGRDEQWRAECPACGKRRNLSIGAGRDRWLVRCFGGCQARDVLEHAGLRFDDSLYEAEAVGENTSAAQAPRSSFLVPCSSSSENEASDRDEPEVEWLLREHGAGRVAPLPVALPPLPADAAPAARQVADFYALVRGLRLWAGDNRDVPFAVRWVAAHLDLPPTIVVRALAQLATSDVLIGAGSLPGRGGRGTAKYAPGETNVVPLARRVAS